MQRLVEQLTDEGELFEGDASFGRVHYHLSVYQHFSDVEGESVPAHVEVEGRITAIDGLDIADLYRHGAELVLRLSDGRRLEIIIADAKGTIRPTGHGFGEPPDLVI